MNKTSEKLREIEAYMAAPKKSCENSCIFCFIDQLPKGLRHSLYFKDDDEKLSFLYGNYITLTNMYDEHIEQIIKLRISPVNISVHTTNRPLRVKMMNNSRAGEVLDYIKRLSDAHIDINAQVVLCKNINDGPEVEKTLSELCAFPAIQSISAVPAGFTKYRGENHLFALEPLDRQSCEDIIKTADKIGEENLKKRRSRIVYCADELYLKAGIEIPGGDYYEDYPQYENGVGMIRSFCDDYHREIKKAKPPDLPPRKISLATGEAAYGLIKTLADDLAGRYKNLTCQICKIKNRFFGGEVTVAGLVTGGDIIAGLAPHKGELGGGLLLPSVMLRYERDLFLDGSSVRDIEDALGVKVTIVENNARDFIKKVLYA
ncbi:MAG: DUF512 domain-containing protein [Oscillospiraceae bacterium]|nr:DUF512 domain-containing protein [Oscillospiraceae bacterium]